MSDIADDIFDEQQRWELLVHSLKKDCPKAPDYCDWFRNDEGMLVCSGCGRQVDE